jgi:DNA-binding GntR family transcriptional regulator
MHVAAIAPPDTVGRLTAPATLRQAVVDRLRQAIITGALPPGMLLREVALATHLGASATPVREAFGTLASEGLVEIEAHKLKRVAQIDLQAVRDMLRVQMPLWRLGNAWGMPHVDAARVLALEAVVEAYRDALAAEDYPAVVDASQDFHGLFIAASGNAELVRATRDRRALIARFLLAHGKATLSQGGLRHLAAMLRSFRREQYEDVLDRLDQMAGRMIALTQPQGPPIEVPTAAAT